MGGFESTVDVSSVEYSTSITPLDNSVTTCLCWEICARYRVMQTSRQPARMCSSFGYG